MCGVCRMAQARRSRRRLCLNIAHSRAIFRLRLIAALVIVDERFLVRFGVIVIWLFFRWRAEPPDSADFDDRVDDPELDDVHEDREEAHRACASGLVVRNRHDTTQRTR